jgi:hypothetical protein
MRWLDAPPAYFVVRILLPGNWKYWMIMAHGYGELLVLPGVLGAKLDKMI